MAVLTAVTSWTQEDVLHLGRRAGFGLSPERAAALAAQDPSAVVDAWVDGALATAGEVAAFEAALAHADPVDEPAQGSTEFPVAAVPGPHPYLVGGAHAWRNDLTRAQAALTFRMQYAPHPMAERLALFLHNLFATGHAKVGSTALMLQQQETLRALGTGPFEDLHAAVSRDPAMLIWLDSVLNRADGRNVPNENYAREAMELFSLGADNGYNQKDITELAKALSGWSITVRDEDRVKDPRNADGWAVARGTFRVFDGAPAGGERIWSDPGAASPPATLPRRRIDGVAPVRFLDRDFADVNTSVTGQAKGEDVLRSIFSSRTAQAATFLAGRLVRHFVTGAPAQSDLDGVRDLLVGNGLHLGDTLKVLLKSQWFYDPANRFALAQGPVDWAVRAARALCDDLATADAATAAQNRFPAWALATDTFDLAGMRYLDPSGPNGWSEDLAWLNSNTARYRAKLAAGIALGETFQQGGADRMLFPSDPVRWFPAAPASAPEVLDRLVALLQPAPLPAEVQADWLGRLWPGAFTWDAASQRQARALAFLILCSPSGQLA